MLQRENGSGKPLKTFAFLVAVELEEGTLDTDAAASKIADALLWVEGVGDIDVTVMGEVDVIEDDDTNKDVNVN